MISKTSPIFSVFLQRILVEKEESL